MIFKTIELSQQTHPAIASKATTKKAKGKTISLTLDSRGTFSGGESMSGDQVTEIRESAAQIRGSRGAIVNRFDSYRCGQASACLRIYLMRGIHNWVRDLTQAIMVIWKILAGNAGI